MGQQKTRRKLRGQGPVAKLKLYLTSKEVTVLPTKLRSWRPITGGYCPAQKRLRNSEVCHDAKEGEVSLLLVKVGQRFFYSTATPFWPVAKLLLVFRLFLENKSISEELTHEICVK